MSPRQKNPNRQAGGRLAKASGDAFEDWISGQHMMAKNRGILAHVAHTYPEAKYIKGTLTYVKKGVADFSGTLEGGRSLAEEAKSTKDVLLDKSQLKPKQIAHLETVARAGGLALLLVEFRQKTHPFYQRFAIPWLEVPWTVIESAETVSALALMKWIVPPDTCYLARYHAGGPSSSPSTLRRYARD